MSNKLLEQYIRNVVNESLQSAFVDPFVDVFKTAMHGIEDISARTKSLFKTFWKALPTLFVPLLDYDLKSIKDQEKEEIEAIREKYNDVLERNNAAFRDTDLVPFSFLMNPQMFLARKVAEKTPYAGLATLKTLEVLSGGNPKVIDFKNKFIQTFNLNKKPNNSSSPSGTESDTWGGYGNGSGYGGLGDTYSMSDANIDYGGMSEATEQPPQQDIWQQLRNLVNDPNLFSKNSIAQQMAMDAMKVYVDHVAKFMAIKSYDELIQKYGKFLAKIDAELKNNTKNAKPEDIQVAKNDALQQMKTMYKNFYIQKIQSMSASSPLTSAAAQRAIQQISSLK